ncbi:MAG: ABC transporter substrate binding protein [Bacteroidota bacterium]
MQKVRLLRSVAALTVAVLSCSLGGAVHSANIRTIGVALLTHEHRFYQELEEGLAGEARKAGLKLAVAYGEFDHARQVAQIKAFIDRKVDALVLAPCDSTAVGEAIVKANTAKIPVFTVDIANHSGKGKVVAHIGSDNAEGGRQAGRLMVQALAGKGKIVIINHPRVSSVIDRVAAFKEYVRTYPGIQVIADIPAWGQRDRAMSIMEDLLLMLPDVKGVFAINDDSALGAAKAIEAAGRTGEIKIVGYDGTPEARKAIDAGIIYGDVIQYPQEIGRLAVKAMAAHFRGEHVASLIPVRIGIYTRATR